MRRLAKIFGLAIVALILQMSVFAEDSDSEEIVSAKVFVYDRVTNELARELVQYPFIFLDESDADYRVIADHLLTKKIVAKPRSQADLNDTKVRGVVDAQSGAKSALVGVKVMVLSGGECRATWFWSANGFAGGGAVYVLRKKDDSWVVVRTEARFSE